MSYILDALRRAQAERERGQVPGLHAQPGLGGRPPPVIQGRGRGARSGLWVLGAVLLLGLIAVLAWALLAPRASAPSSGVGLAGDPRAVAQRPAPMSTPMSTPAPLSPAASPVAPAWVVVSAPEPAQATAPAPAVAPRRLPAPEVPPAQPPELAAPAARTVASAASNPAPAAPAAVAAPVQAVPAAAAGPTPAAIPPPLTAEQRREWPALAVGGSVWSESPAARFVILGGQVVREGETTAEGVQVERITPKAVVLKWRDQRGSLPL